MIAMSLRQITIYDLNWLHQKKKRRKKHEKNRPQLWYEVYKMCSRCSILVPCFCGTYSSPYPQFLGKCIRFQQTEMVALSSFSLLVNVLTWGILLFFLLFRDHFATGHKTGLWHYVSFILIYLNYVHIFTH